MPHMTPGEGPSEQAQRADAAPAVSAPLAGGTEDPQPESPRGALRGQARSWATATPYRLPMVVALVGLVLSAPFGGWRTAQSEATPVVAAEEVVVAAPFELTLERAYYAALPSESFYALDPGQHYVVVIGTVTSRHDTTVNAGLLLEAIAVEGLPEPIDILGAPVEEEPPTPALYSATDSREIRRLGPDLTYEIGLVYQSAAEEFPDELTLHISGHTWRPDTFTRVERWLDPAEVAEVVVPLGPQEGS